MISYLYVYPVLILTNWRIFMKCSVATITSYATFRLPAVNPNTETDQIY
jgi:hypothetical protein